MSFRNRHAVFLTLFACLVMSAVILLFWRPPDDTFYSHYEKLHIGMTYQEAEAILGTGTVVPANQVPGISNVTQRGSSTAELIPAVTGDSIARWQERNAVIYIGLKRGVVCSKRYLHYGS